jgi:iron complex transport system ATP-binding protein
MKQAAVTVEVNGLQLRAGATASGRVLCSNLELAVNAGECWVVLGPNGAGKSTLIATLAGLLPVSAGRIALQRRQLASWPIDELARWRAWCPQFWIDPFPSSVEETVRAMRQQGMRWWSWAGDDDEGAPRRSEVERVLQQLDLSHLREVDVRTLSGGERQRVAIATCLLQGTPWLLLDEPASHLDLSHQQLLVDVLGAHAATGGAVVASLHDIDLAARLATHAVLLDGRGNALAGTRDQVMTPAHLSAAFGVAVDRVEVCGQQRFWVGPVRRSEEALK